MPVQLTAQGKTLFALLSGDIDHHTAPALREQIDNAVTEYRPRMLCLDFSAVSFMDSTGIGFILGRYKKLCVAGGRLKLANVPPQVDKVFRTSGVYSVVEKVR